MLIIRNATDDPVWIVESTGTRSRVDAGQRVIFGSAEACEGPLVAMTPGGDAITRYTGECDGRTWLIGTDGETRSSPTDGPRIVVGANGVGPVRLGMSRADLVALGAKFGIGGMGCHSFVAIWNGVTIRGQIRHQADVQIIYLDDWGETPEGIAAGDRASNLSAAHHDYVPTSPLFVTRASGDAFWAFRFDWSRRPHTVAAIALIHGDQTCTML